MSRDAPPRPILEWLHRWIGLTVGLVFAIVSLSGSALRFQRQFWEWAHGNLTPPGMSGVVGSIDRWIENGKAAVPELGEPIAVWPPHVEHNLSDAGMLIFAGRTPGGLGNMGFAAVLVEPATGKVLGIVDVDRSPAYAPLFLHRDLWAGEVGQIVSGIMAIGTLGLLSLGLYLWWPPRRRLVGKLTGRPWRVTFSRARPLHDWIGVWTVVALAILVASGLLLVQPGWVEPIIDVAAGPESAEAPISAPCGTPLTFDAAIARASALAPSGRFKSLYPADARFERWEIVLAPERSVAHHDEVHVVADLRCGTVAVEGTPATRSAHEAMTMWLADAHVGTAFGPVGPVVVSLVGLSPVVMIWSGFLMWIRRRRRVGTPETSPARERSAVA
ncbi:MAG: PepSY-associated TM helix domain-containing protein [Vicinamibacteraceae bacterium]